MRLSCIFETSLLHSISYNGYIQTRLASAVYRLINLNKQRIFLKHHRCYSGFHLINHKIQAYAQAGQYSTECPIDYAWGSSTIEATREGSYAYGQAWHLAAGGERRWAHQIPLSRSSWPQKAWDIGSTMAPTQALFICAEVLIYILQGWKCLGTPAVIKAGEQNLRRRCYSLDHKDVTKHKIYFQNYTFKMKQQQQIPTVTGGIKRFKGTPQKSPTSKNAEAQRYSQLSQKGRHGGSQISIGKDKYSPQQFLKSSAKQDFKGQTISKFHQKRFSQNIPTVSSQNIRIERVEVPYCLTPTKHVQNSRSKSKLLFNQPLATTQQLNELPTSLEYLIRKNLVSSPQSSTQVIGTNLNCVSRSQSRFIHQNQFQQTQQVRNIIISPTNSSSRTQTASTFLSNRRGTQQPELQRPLTRQSTYSLNNFNENQSNGDLLHLGKNQQYLLLRQESDYNKHSSSAYQQQMSRSSKSGIISPKSTSGSGSALQHTPSNQIKFRRNLRPRQQ